MSRKKQPPRLYLRDRSQEGRASVWVIRDGTRFVSTGCTAEDVTGAEYALQEYLAKKFEHSGTSRATQLSVAEVLKFYWERHALPNIIRKDVIRYRLSHVGEWWGARAITDIKRSTCADYIDWRVAKEYVITKKDGTKKITKVSASTARKDLETLGAALKFYHSEFALDVLPVVTLPPKPAAREEWLTRDQVAALLQAARRNKLYHAARFILIAVYTGSRTNSILKLQWAASTSGGWFDIERGILYRRGRNTRETKKRQPPCRIHKRLLPHLRRWCAADQKVGIRHVITFKGEPIEKLRRSWDTIRDEAKRTAGIDFHFVRHTLRHTAATWLMQAGVDPWEAAGFLGMSPETLERVYGHHSPHFQAAAAEAVAPKSKKIKTATN